jgi:hypothetical protein
MTPPPCGICSIVPAARAPADRPKDDMNQHDVQPEPAGLPTLPPPTPALAPDAVVPVLPMAPPVQPSPYIAPVFDAKAMVASQRRKVENPAYGHMPKGTPEGKAAVEAAKKAMRQRRRRNKFVGRVVGIVLLSGVSAGGYYAYKAFQDDQEPNAAGDAADANVDPAGATPVGQQAEVIEALDDVNSGAAPSAGGLMDAVNDAQEAVGDINANATGTSVAPDVIAKSEVAPESVLSLAEEIEPLNGFDRYVIDVDQALYTARRSVTDWLNALRAMPHDDTITDQSLIPRLDSGEMLIAVRSADGVTVDQLVIFGPDQDITIDA